jgi:formate dehydrogenase major subunit
MLIKKTNGTATKTRLGGAFAAIAGTTMDRRAFLKRSGLTVGGIAAVSALPFATVQRAEAATQPRTGPITLKKNICTHCSVGCTVLAEVQNGVWIGQEPNWESPINLGTHCAKGAATRELVHGDRRVRYPMKLVNGQWQKIGWDQAYTEITAKLKEIRDKSGPDSVYWLGSAKFTNEAAYLFRKFVAFWGTNHVDHQARICHSTTVAGVANTVGFGAMTNSYNDISNSKAIMFMGSNAAEAHPVSLQHILRGKEINRAPVIVVDPRFTRTAAHSTEYVRIRPGTDIPFIWGLLWHVFKNGWEDKEYIRKKVFGFEEAKKEIEKWTPAEVENVVGVKEDQMKRVAEIMAKNRPSTLIWCMGVTQHTVGTANVRALSTFQLALGNVGISGGGLNIFRGHTNVQGATDIGLEPNTLPHYYPLTEAGWKHWCRVWDVSFDSMKARFDTHAGKSQMHEVGTTSTRWFDLCTVDKKDLAQKDHLKAMFFWGHGSNTVVRMPEMKKVLDDEAKLPLLVVADPHPTVSAILGDRKNGTYLLPICTSYEMDGSRTASNRSLQWGEQIVKPIFESKTDYEVLYQFAIKLGFDKEFAKNYEIKDGAPTAESIALEQNRGAVLTGYSGQSPARMKSHMAHQADFDKSNLIATKGPHKGEFYGMPWPCWGHADMKHPGSPILYNNSLSVKEGGGAFRARFGVAYQGRNMLAEGAYSKDSELKDGYPEFTMAVLKKLGWDKDLTDKERETIEKIGGDTVSWATDLSFGIIRVAMAHGAQAMGNSKARVFAFGLPDPVPVHREPIYTPREDLVAKYPAFADRRAFRLPHLGKSVQDRMVKEGIPKKFPIILSSGRLVEYEGGGEETRSNKWLAELQQDMFIEINVEDARTRGIVDGSWVWVYGAENSAKTKVKALVTERVGKGVAWMPFHFGGWWQGQDLRSKYPKGADPVVLGESVNTLTTYGFDTVTHMQETKCTLCQIEAIKA